MTRTRRIIADRAKRDRRESALSASSAFYRGSVSRIRNIESQSGRGGLERRVPGVSAFDLQLALIDLVATGGEERIAVFAAEGQIRDSAVRGRNDRVHAPELIANLNAHTRRNIEPPVAVDAHAVGLAAVDRVGHVDPIILLLGFQRAVGLDLITVDPVRTVISDVKQRLVGRERYSIGVAQPCVHDFLLTVRLDQPDVALVDGGRVRLRDVDVPVARYHNIVAANAFGDDRRRTSGFFDVISDDFLLAARHRIEASVRAECLSVGSLRIGDELAYLTVETDFVNLVAPPIGEENLAFGVDRRTFSKLVTLAHQLPSFAWNEKRFERGVLRRACLHRLRPPLPQPAHRVGKDRRAVLAVVPAFAPDVLNLITGEHERTLHRLVGHPPVAWIAVVVVVAVLQKDADRLRFVFANERRIVMPPAQPDVGSDGAEDARKPVGPLPGGGESAKRPRRRSADGAVVSVL